MCPSAQWYRPTSTTMLGIGLPTNHPASSGAISPSRLAEGIRCPACLIAEFADVVLLGGMPCCGAELGQVLCMRYRYMGLMHHRSTAATDLTTGHQPGT
jgi:hypothetical protein